MKFNFPLNAISLKWSVLRADGITNVIVQYRAVPLFVIRFKPDRASIIYLIEGIWQYFLQIKKYRKENAVSILKLSDTLQE